MRRVFLIGTCASALLWGLPAAAFAQSQQAQAPGFGHGFLIDKHLAAGLTCSSCHAESPPSKPAAATTCLTCHGGSYDTLAGTTAKDDPNPHQSHLGNIPCGACHEVHNASRNVCASCHKEFNFKVP